MLEYFRVTENEIYALDGENRVAYLTRFYDGEWRVRTSAHIQGKYLRELAEKLEELNEPSVVHQ